MTDAVRASPRQKPVFVSCRSLNDAEELLKSARLCDGVVAVLEAAHARSRAAHDASATQDQVDASGFLQDVFAKLRRDPWCMLGVSRACTDDEVKRAYRKLALKFHPDKSKLESADLFACLHCAYENLATAESRADFERQLDEEDALLAKARQTTGPSAEAELERKFNRERRRRERAQYQSWRSKQQCTLDQWDRDERRFERQRVEHENFDRVRIKRDQERRRRVVHRETGEIRRRQAHKRDVSRKLQAKYEREEQEARARIAMLDAESAKIRMLKKKASCSMPPIRPSRPSPEVAANGGVVGKPSPWEPWSARDQGPKASSPRQRARPPITNPRSNVMAFTFDQGPMGFTLLDRLASPATARGHGTGKRKSSTRAPKQRSDLACCVLKLEHDRQGLPGQAEQLGVQVGDILMEVNGLDLRSLSFASACSIIAKAQHPRRLTFCRKIPGSTES